MRIGTKSFRHLVAAAIVLTALSLSAKLVRDHLNIFINFEESDEEDEEESDDDSPPEFQGARGRRRRMEGPPIILLNYKDVSSLSHFITEQGKILPKRTTKVSAAFQRGLGTAIKRARYLALLPYMRREDA